MISMCTLRFLGANGLPLKEPGKAEIDFPPVLYKVIIEICPPPLASRLHW